MTAVEYWHGGPAGISGKILPPTLTQAKGTVEVLDGSGLDTEHVRSDRVFITTAYETAVLFSCCWPDPMVYAVWPDSDPEPDPDCSDGEMSLQCQSATILFSRRPDPELVREARAVFGGA